MLRRVVGFGLVLAASTFGVAGSVGASEQPGVVVREGHPFTKQFGPLNGPGVVPEQLNHPVPADCKKPPGQVWCDVIPVTVDIPADYDELTDEYITRVTLSWDEKSDDMDLFLYDPHLLEVGSSATSNNPEKSSSADPKFFVVVVNSLGVNQGYSLRFSFSRKRITPVTEKPSLFGPEAEPTSTTASTSAPTTIPTQVTATTAPLELPPPDLNDPDFADSSQALDDAVLGDAPAVAAKPAPAAAPVSAALLIGVLGVVPAGAIGVGSVLFRRRAARMLDL